MKHFVKMDDLTVEEIYDLIKDAEKMEKGEFSKADKAVFVANLFYENSTRTKISFIMAENNLGLRVTPFDVETSSAKKGESLYDTVRTLESIGVKGVIIRHPEDRYYDHLVGKVGIPIINGGDGSGDHPSQCLLDLYTIWQI